MKYPTHVVVDTHDGYPFWAGADGELFTLESATAFARERNAEMKPEHRTYALFRLEPEYMQEEGNLPLAGYGKSYTLSDDGKVVHPL